MNKRPSVHASARPLVFLAVPLLSAFALVHCSNSDASTPVPTPPASANEAGTSSDSDAGSTSSAPDSGPSGDAGGTISTGEGGIIDSGLNDGGPVVVCGGSTGNPAAVPVLDWEIMTYSPKYAGKLGTPSEKTEPLGWSATGAIVTGTKADSAARVSSSTGGPGMFSAVPGIVKADFASNLMPSTDLHAGINTVELGWTTTLEALFDLRTSLLDQTWKSYRVFGRSGYFSGARWELVNPVATAFAQPSDYYVAAIDADHGSGWFVTVLFDADCKAANFELMTGPSLNFLQPTGSTRAEISNFLVDNNAKLYLTVVIFGAESPQIKAALTGTQASAATLDAFESTMTALDAALDSYNATPADPDYDKVTSGTDPNWVIGRLTATQVP